MTLPMTLLILALVQRELFGPPVFEQIAEFECSFSAPRSATPERLKSDAALSQVAFRSVDRKRRVARMFVGTEPRDVDLSWSSVAISFVKPDPNDLITVTVFRAGQEPASPMGWKYAAVLSRHIASSVSGAAVQAEGTCRAPVSF
jgi:hypothetical protein